jgi:CHRD domain
MRRVISTILIASLPWVAGMAGMESAAQTKGPFRARLSTVPIDVAMQSTVAGSGSATATLTGRKVSVTGTFANLKSPATIAKIHVAPKGMRGPALLDLTVTAATSGTLSGEFDLTPAQVRDLADGRFYIQLHSEKAPEGNLWGWLLPQETRR